MVEERFWTPLMYVMMGIALVFVLLGFRFASASSDVANEGGSPLLFAGYDLATYGSFDLDFTSTQLATTSPSITSTIHLADSGITLEGDASLVSIKGSTVYILGAGTFALDGSLSDGQIVIEADKSKVSLVLQGAHITCSDNAAIYSDQADELLLCLAAGTENSVTCGPSFNDDARAADIDGAIYSKSDLCIQGEGSLTVQGAYQHGIVSKDDLVITGGTITVDAVGDGIKGRDCVKVAEGTLSITAGSDGIQSNNDEDASRGFVFIEDGSYTIDAGNDGIQAETALLIAGGTFDIVSGGGSSGTAWIPGTAGVQNGTGGAVPTFGDIPETDATMGDATDGFENRTPPSDGSGSTLTVPSMPRDGSSDGVAPAVPDGDLSDSASDGTAPPDAMDPPATGDDTWMPEDDGGSIQSEGTTDVAEASDTSDSFKGLKAGVVLMVADGELHIDASDDTLHCNGEVYIAGGSFGLSSDDDGIHADGALVIDGGDVAIAQANEGIEGLTITINAGTVDVASSDDGMNASDGSGGGFQMGAGGSVGGSTDCLITINGGLVAIHAGGDGIDSNGSIVINGGTVLVSSTNTGADSAIDFGDGGDCTCTVNGGTLVATGASQMAEAFDSASSQVTLLYVLDESQVAGTLFSLTDSSGSLILAFAPAQAYGCVAVSSPDLALDMTVVLKTGGTISDLDSYGFSTQGTLDGALEAGTITLDSTAVSNGLTGMGGIGGFRMNQGGGGANMGAGPTGAGPAGTGTDPADTGTRTKMDKTV